MNISSSIYSSCYESWPQQLNMIKFFQWNDLTYIHRKRLVSAIKFETTTEEDPIRSAHNEMNKYVQGICHTFFTFSLS